TSRMGSVQDHRLIVGWDDTRWCGRTLLRTWTPSPLRAHNRFARVGTSCRAGCREPDTNTTRPPRFPSFLGGRVLLGHLIGHLMGLVRQDPPESAKAQKP